MSFAQLSDGEQQIYDGSLWEQPQEAFNPDFSVFLVALIQGLVDGFNNAVVVYTLTSGHCLELIARIYSGKGSRVFCWVKNGQPNHYPFLK